MMAETEARVAMAPIGIPDSQDVARIYRKLIRPRSYQSEITLLINWATLLESGIPLAESLRRLGQTTRDRALSVGLESLADGVENGIPLGDMIGAYPQLLPVWWDSFLAIGEQRGDLPGVLHMLQRYLAERVKLQRRLGWALFGPALTTVLGLVALSVFFFGLFPALALYLAAIGARLPAPLEWYVNHQTVLWYGSKITLSLGIAGLMGAILAPPGWSRHWFDRVWLRLPIFGTLARKYELLRILHGLHMLVGKGISLPAGLESLARSSSNRAVQRALLRAADALDEGAPLAETLAEIPVMLPEATQITVVGWTSGRLEEMLGKYLARLFDELLDDAKRALTTIINIVLAIVATFVILLVLMGFLMLILGLQAAISQR